MPSSDPQYRLPYQLIIGLLGLLILILSVLYFVIPPANSSTPANSPRVPAGNSAEKIDINTASRAELESVDGIGPKTASRIIERRKQQRFQSIEEVRDLTGVNEANFDRMRDEIIAK